jgi:hypothetical protein
MDPARMLAGFPTPWAVVEATGEFIVTDARGRTLAHFFWWGDGMPAFLTRDEARCLAEKFAKVPSSVVGTCEEGDCHGAISLITNSGAAGQSSSS